MKTIGVQKELNEIAEELVRQGFDVKNLENTNEKLDAIVYYEDKNHIGNLNISNSLNKDKVVKFNAAKTNIDQIVTKLKEI